MLINRLSDNVGDVKQFLSTLHHGLEQERHFALVDGLLFANHGSLVIHSGQDIRSDPCISSVRIWCRAEPGANTLVLHSSWFCS